MKNSKAFTRIDLIAVIFCIVLILAVTLSGLNLPREMARQLACANILKIFGQANNHYISEWNGYCVPIGVTTWLIRNGVQTNQLTTIKWPENIAFAKYLSVETYRDDYDKSLGFYWPYEFVCPSDKNAKGRKPEAFFVGVLLSYGYNVTDWLGRTVTWGGWSDLGTVVGHKIDSIEEPAEKLMFTEGVGDWWVQWQGAHYQMAWDKFGFATNHYYRSYGGMYGYGCVAYRHSEGANILFYDGHVQWMSKQGIFQKEKWNVPNDKKQPGMWAVNNPYAPKPPPQWWEEDEPPWEEEE